MTNINTFNFFVQHKKILSSLGVVFGLTMGSPPSYVEAHPIQTKLESRSLNKFVIKSRTREKIRDAFKEKKYQLTKDSYEMMSYSKTVLETVLPQELLDSLKIVGKTGQPNLIRITGLPVDEIPASDNVEEKSRGKTKIAESVMLGIANIMGYMLYTNPKEQGGKLIHNIHPVKGHEKNISSKGKRPFYLHTESPFESTPPYFLMLMSLEGDSQAKTSYFPLKPFLSTLPSWVIEIYEKGRI